MADPKNLNELIDQLEPSVRKAFKDALANVRSDVQFAILERAIRDGDIIAAINAIGLDESYFRPLDDALRAAHLAGADWTIRSVKRAGRRSGVSVSGQFNSRNLRAEGILRQYSADRVTAITATTRQAIQETLSDAIQRGSAPRTVALELVGRVSQGGVRTGGIIGLDPSRAQLVRDMRNSLSTQNGVGVLGFDADGNPIKKFWLGRDGTLQSTYTVRDKRFDSVIARSIRTGRAVPEIQIGRMTNRYTSRLQRVRGEAIARTELLGSLHAAQDEGIQQLVDGNQIEQENVTGIWDASADQFTRDDHRDANGQRRKQGEPFDVGGSLMMRPGDSSLGAPAKQIVNCRCYKRIDIDFLAGLRNRLSAEELRTARAAL